ncbi:unnamed protein product, partial [Ixodes persulcatus]
PVVITRRYAVVAVTVGAGTFFAAVTWIHLTSNPTRRHSKKRRRMGRPGIVLSKHATLTRCSRENGRTLARRGGAEFPTLVPNPLTPDMSAHTVPGQTVTNSKQPHEG